MEICILLFINFFFFIMRPFQQVENELKLCVIQFYSVISLRIKWMGNMVYMYNVHTYPYTNIYVWLKINVWVTHAKLITKAYISNWLSIALLLIK